MTQKKRKAVVVKVGSTGPGARDLDRLDAIRKGPLKEMIECLEACSATARFESGAWHWSAHDLVDDPTVPFRSLPRLVPEHQFEEIDRRTEYDTDQIGELHYRDSDTRAGCRALCAMYVWGGHFTGHTGATLIVYPSARAWDREAKALVNAKKKADEDEAEASRDREERIWDDDARFERQPAEERTYAQRPMIDRLRLAAKAAHEDLTLVAKHAMYRRSGSSASTRVGYSDEMPTQEQVRAAFWGRLQGQNSMACEMGWNLYETAGKGLNRVGSVDLAGFSMEGETGMPILLLDVRRVWSLDRRFRSPSQQRSDFAIDLKKLRGSPYGLHSRPQRPDLVGVLIFGFASDAADFDDEFERLYPSLEEHGLSRITLVRGDQIGIDRRSPVWRVPVETIDGTEMADMFMQIDLLVLNGQ